MFTEGLKIKNTFVSLRTAKTTAAIGSIELRGPAAPAILRQIFRPNTSDFSLTEGRIHYGHFIENDEIIDDGVIGVEGPGRFALHSHGNPLILERLLRLLERQGVSIISFDEMLLRRYHAESDNLIEAEAKAESLKAVSLAGMQLIRNQATHGLAAAVRRWLETDDLDAIRNEARHILDRSRIAERLLRPVRILLVGPPNSGKSTLLNRFAGREQALVSATPGTTRDWVSAHGRLDLLAVEWIDTAGLDEQLRAADALELAAQAATLELLQSADLILYILDIKKPGTVTPFQQKQVTVPILTVLNKCDLLKSPPANALCISAQTGYNIDALAAAILKTLEVQTLTPTTPIAFTPRQESLIRKISTADTLPELRGYLKLLIRENP